MSTKTDRQTDRQTDRHTHQYYIKICMDSEHSKGKYERVEVTHCNDIYNTDVVRSRHQMSYLFTVVTLNCTEASSLIKVGSSLTEVIQGVAAAHDLDI